MPYFIKYSRVVFPHSLAYIPALALFLSISFPLIHSLSLSFRVDAQFSFIFFFVFQRHKLKVSTNNNNVLIKTSENKVGTFDLPSDTL